MDELTWRTAELSDAGALADLFGVVERTAPMGLETEASEVEERLSAPRLDLRTDTLAGLDAAGRLCGYAEAADMGVGNGQFRVRLTGALRPGLDSGFVLDWLIGRARSMRRERHPDLPGVCGARCAAGDQARLDALTAAGFEVDHWHREMTRGLAAAMPGGAAPDGVVVMTFEPRYSEATRMAQNDAYADDPHALLLGPEDWPRHVTARGDFRPAASFVALDGDEVAAFVCSLEQSGTGILHVLGTRPRWRGHGLAAGLTGRALAAYRDAGLGTARVEVCSSNTRAVGLYSKLGFAASGAGYAIMYAPVPA